MSYFRIHTNTFVFSFFTRNWIIIGIDVSLIFHCVLDPKIIMGNIRTGTDNPHRMILNKLSVVLCGHFSFSPKVVIEYKFDYIYYEPRCNEMEWHRYCGVMVCMLASIAVDCVFKPRSGQTKNCVNDTYSCSAKHAALTRLEAQMSLYRSPDITKSS